MPAPGRAAGCSDIWIKMLNRFRCRQREPELMDQPGLGEPLHCAALAGLGRINRFSGSGRILWKRSNAGLRPTRPHLRLLDLASGGGDVAIDVARRAARAGARVLVDGCDVSPFAVRDATARASERQVENVQFFRQDVLNAPLPDGYDVVMCSLFLHHLPEETAAALLGKMAAAAQRLVLVNDLCRSTVGYGLARLGCRFLTRSPIVHVDGPRSVQSAFSMKEIREVARQGGLAGATVESALAVPLSLTAEPRLNQRRSNRMLWPDCECNAGERTVRTELESPARDSTLTVEEAAAITWDVAVIGAGPTGARWWCANCHCWVCGRCWLIAVRFPAKKSAAAASAAWDDDCSRASDSPNLLDSSHASPSGRFDLAAGGRRVSFELPAGAAVSRFSFDAALVHHAVQAGVGFVSGTTTVVRGLSAGCRLRRIVLQQGDRRLVAETRMVIVADGLGRTSLKQHRAFAARRRDVAHWARRHVAGDGRRHRLTQCS